MTDPIKLSTDRAAAVNLNVQWIPIKHRPPPLGVKLLLINRAHGVIVIGDYQPRFGHTHWQALPKFSQDETQ